MEHPRCVSPLDVNHGANLHHLLTFFLVFEMQTILRRLALWPVPHMRAVAVSGLNSRDQVVAALHAGCTFLSTKK